MSIWAPPPPDPHRVKTPLCRSGEGDVRCNLYREHKGPHRITGTSQVWPAHFTAVAGDESGIWALCACGWEAEVGSPAEGRLRCQEHEHEWEA